MPRKFTIYIGVKHVRFDGDRYRFTVRYGGYWGHNWIFKPSNLQIISPHRYKDAMGNWHRVGGLTPPIINLLRVALVREINYLAGISEEQTERYLRQMKAQLKANKEQQKKEAAL